MVEFTFSGTTTTLTVPMHDNSLEIIFLGLVHLVLLGIGCNGQLASIDLLFFIIMVTISGHFIYSLGNVIHELISVERTN